MSRKIAYSLRCPYNRGYTREEADKIFKKINDALNKGRKGKKGRYTIKIKPEQERKRGGFLIRVEQN